jgi:hypothetical protein
MPNNLLLLPLLAGYLFLHHAVRFRFRVQWLDGYRLLIESAGTGLVFLALSRLAVVAIKAWIPQLKVAWVRFAPSEPQYLGTALGSVLLGLLVAEAANSLPPLEALKRFGRWCLLSRRIPWPRRIYRYFADVRARNKAQARFVQIENHSNALLRFLESATNEVALVSLTLDSRKWYMGYVAELVKLDLKEDYLRILPIVSGYRKSDDLAIVRTNDYRKVYEAVGANDRFVITIRLADIHDARLFDNELTESSFASGQAEGR